MILLFGRYYTVTASYMSVSGHSANLWTKGWYMGELVHKGKFDTRWLLNEKNIPGKMWGLEWMACMAADLPSRKRR
jgi:hypothetical protein